MERPQSYTYFFPVMLDYNKRSNHMNFCVTVKLFLKINADCFKVKLG